MKRKGSPTQSEKALAPKSPSIEAAAKKYKKELAQFGLSSFYTYDSAADFARQFQRCTLLVEDPKYISTSSNSSSAPDSTIPSTPPIGK